jgi:hypothetical protein
MSQGNNSRNIHLLGRESESQRVLLLLLPLFSFLIKTISGS